MMSPFVIVAAGLCYLVVLFVVARIGDLRRNSVNLHHRATIYPLSLAVYCTTWTFFGSVGVAASSGLSFLAIYIGPILLFTLGYPLVRRIISLSKRHRITSVADFLAARYGKSVKVAAVATVIAVVGTVPYIALQLKAISSSLSALISPGSVGFNGEVPLFGDISLMIVASLAIFAILFGTRHADATEHQYGLMLAIALESAVKLIAFLIVGAFVTWFMFGGIGDLYSQSMANPAVRDMISSGVDTGNMLVLIFLSFIVFLLLPRQFHVAVVENQSERELSRARWLFPLYLVLINLFVLPIAAAGILTFGDSVNADGFVLALPEIAGSRLISLIAFIGGLSAGTAMVIVACVALAIMISNHLFLPLYLQGGSYDIRQDVSNMERRILNIRRTAITLILGLAFVYYKAADNTQALASIGLVSFAAAAQLAPAFFGGLFWSGANARGAIFGMGIGFSMWAYTLLLPTIIPGGEIGTYQIYPSELMTGGFLSPISLGLLISLAFNTLGLIFGSISRRANPIEDHQAILFTAYRDGKLHDPSATIGLVTVEQIGTTLGRYLGEQRARRALEAYWQEFGDHAHANDPASADLIRYSEETLASAIGSSSSRLVHSLLLQRYEETSSTNLQLLDQATEAIRYNQSVLQTALDQLDQGITVFDADHRLSFWNRQFRTLLDLPVEFGQAGTPLSKVAAQIGQKHRIDENDKNFVDLEARILNKRGAWGLALQKAERILEIRSSPMPGGGIVTAWNDVTERMMVAEALREANESLEKRVEERTSDLVRANRKLEQATQAADQANQSKTRFFAAAGHDLLQPLNAAKLYTSTLLESAEADRTLELANNIGKSLESVEEILGSVLAISRLDSSSHKINVGDYSLQRLLDQLEIEFRPMAEEKNIDLRIIPTTLWVRSDAAYLRRLLQNLISNSLKYTEKGTVLVGCRRTANTVNIAVVDTGLGISEADRKTIFAEFERLDAGAKLAPGLGLGLSIVDRISKLLDHPIEFGSVPGKGTYFSVTVPRVASKAASGRRRGQQGSTSANRLQGMRLLCIDNDTSILDGMRGLLGQWGCIVATATDGKTACRIIEGNESQQAFIPDAALVDYHLDNENGIDAAALIRSAVTNRANGRHLPCVLVTADRSAEVKKLAEARGINVLNKPVRPAALRAMLSQTVIQKIAAE